MATLAYATTGTGVIAGGLGWINYGVFTIAAGSTVSNITATLRDGSILKFNLTNTTVSGGGTSFVATASPTFFAAPFGAVGYTGIVGNVVLYMPGTFAGQQRLTMSNITVTDPFGLPVPTYTIYACDGEASRNGEDWVYTTNGSPWALLTTIGTGASPVTTGTGTTVVTLTGNATGTFNAPVLATINPTTVIAQINQSLGGQSGIVFGISITKVSLNKVITSRYNASDQFKLDITGTPAASTITFGSTFGAQPVSAYSFASIPSGGSPLSYTLSESMAPGSATPITSYSSTIRYTNQQQYQQVQQFQEQ